MNQQRKRSDHVANAAKSRSIVKERAAERTAEIAGKQAQLKREAQERWRGALGLVTHLEPRMRDDLTSRAGDHD
jgi:hypothetical protein